MIFIRTDANADIATGHMMRCLTVAGELKKLGNDIIFLISDNRSCYLIKDKGFKYIVLNTSWDNYDTEEETEIISKILTESLINSGMRPLILVDSYYVNNAYFKRLRNLAYMVFFDDMCRECYDVDILINYNVYYSIYDYDRIYKNSKCRLLLGAMYAPLREQFRNNLKNVTQISKKSDNERDNILVICGGGDTQEFIKGFLEFLKHYRNSDRYDYTIIVGPYNTGILELKRMSAEHDNITLLENVTDLAAIMRGCNKAISAAGTVLYECCAMRLPTIFFCIAENQENDIKAFMSDDLMLYAGDLRQDKKEVYISIFDHLLYLDNNPEVVKAMKKKMAEVTDGYGAVRIAKKIDEIIRTDEIKNV